MNPFESILKRISSSLDREEADDLVAKLKENPFILVRRECKHSLHLIRRKSDLPAAIEQLQGTNCPSCGELVEAVDVVFVGNKSKLS